MTTIKHFFDDSIIRSYDIRGVFNKTLFEKDAKVIGQLFGLEVGKNKKINVGYDGRKSSEPLKDSLIEGILESGADVCEIGLVPTPLLYFSTISNNSRGGVMVTGSHNPKNYNGFKLILDGLPFYGEDLINLKKKAQNFLLEKNRGKKEKVNFESEYLKNIFNNFSQDRKLNIVWDSGNGSAGKVMEEISGKIRGQQKLLFKEIDGNFPNHHPDPSDPENLVQCIAEIKKNNFDLGIAFDGDGDRIGVIDDKGRIIAGDMLLLILSKSLVKKNSTIIGDVKCSQVLFDEIENLGGKPVISQTGHSHVKINMKKYDADLAGEMSGHIFFNDNWFGFDDAIYAGARLLSILADEDNITHFFRELPDSFCTPEIKLEIKGFSADDLLKKLNNKKLFPRATNFYFLDGVRIEYEDGFGLARLSNTTPVIVFRFEGDSKVALESIKGDFRNSLLAIMKNIALPF